MQSKRFKKNDAGFVCRNCGLEVLPLRQTSRDHCPACLYSLHVDINPGDRLADCGALLQPVGIEMSAKKGYIILYQCTRCGALKKNKAVPDARQQPDDMDKIIELSSGGF